MREALVILEQILFGPRGEEEAAHFFLKGGEPLSQFCDQIVEDFDTFGSDVEDESRVLSDLGKRYREFGKRCGEAERRVLRSVQ